MKLLENGKFITMESDDYENEITNLRQVFNHMILSIKKLMSKVKEEEGIIAKGKLDIIYAQINPHFLYNTLDTIRWMATEEKYHQIPGIVKALGDILRISINSREALIPIKQEMEYMRGYLVIQRARFGARLNVQMDMGEE